MSLPLFSFPPVIFPSLFSPSLFRLYPKSFSFSPFFFYFSLSHHPLPICLTQTCFPGPAIHRYRIHQQQPASAQWRAPGEGGELGEGLRGKPAGYGVIRVSWRGGYEPSYLITTAAVSGDTWKEKHTGPCPAQQQRRRKLGQEQLNSNCMVGNIKKI